MVGIFQWKMGGNKRHDYHSCFQKRKRNVSNYISLLCPSVFSFRFHKSFFSFRQERAPLLLLLLHLLRSPTTIRVVVLCAAAACGSAPTRCYYYYDGGGGGGGKLEKASATFVQIINHLARLWGSKTHRIRQIEVSALPVVMTCSSYSRDLHQNHTDLLSFLDKTEWGGKGESLKTSCCCSSLHWFTHAGESLVNDLHREVKKMGRTTLCNHTLLVGVFCLLHTLKEGRRASKWRAWE